MFGRYPTEERGVVLQTKDRVGAILCDRILRIWTMDDAGRPLHVQCSYPSRSLVKIITLYEPDPDRWIEFMVRRRS